MAKNPKMVICRNCNNPISEKARICPFCGAKNKKSSFGKVFFLILVIVAIVGVIGTHGFKKREEKIIWNDFELSSMLPEPKSNIGELVADSEERFCIYIYKTSRNEYKDYLAECEKSGYSVESEKDETHYGAWNEDGYKLSLWYIDSDERMQVELETPMEMDELQWPTSGVAAMLPVPKSTVGTIQSESSDRFYVYVGDTPIEEYNAYVNECSEKGFSVDYEKGETYYRADHADGCHISLSYQGNSVMSVEIEKSKDDGVAAAGNEPTDEAESDEAESIVEGEEDMPDTEGTATENENAELVNDMRPEFKEAMDSYESFYNEYCDFLKKYAENPSDLTLLAEYADMMSEAAEMDKKFGEWEDGDLNEAELSYCLEVEARIAKKLADTVQAE